MARRSPAAKNTRERILTAAVETFADIGFAAASPEDIAARAGVTKGAFYYYFADKADLARDLQDRIWTTLQEQAVRALDPDADTLANLERAFLAYLGALGNLGAARFFLRDSWALIGMGDAADRGADLLRTMLDDGVTRGHLRSVDTAATAHILRGAFSEATLYILSGGDEEQTLAVLRHLIRGLAPARTGARK